MSLESTANSERLRLAVEQLVRADRVSQSPIIHARRTVGVQMSYLSSIFSHYRQSSQIAKKEVDRIAIILERSLPIQEENKRLFEQFNEVHSTGMEEEERNFLEHYLEYYRRRFIDGKW